jgi:hypothetical protein
MKGKNKEPGYYSQEGPTWENPAINKEQLLAQKPNWTARYWQQEVLGAFLDSGGAVFREPRKHISGDFEEPKSGEGYAIGADLAKHQDWSVFTIMNSAGHVVHWDRIPQETNWPQQKMRIAELSKRYNRATAFIDCSGIGDPILDDLKSMSVPVKGADCAGEDTAH